MSSLKIIPLSSAQHAQLYSITTFQNDMDPMVLENMKNFIQTWQKECDSYYQQLPVSLQTIRSPMDDLQWHDHSLWTSFQLWSSCVCLTSSFRIQCPLNPKDVWVASTSFRFSWQTPNHHTDTRIIWVMIHSTKKEIMYVVQTCSQNNQFWMGAWIDWLYFPQRQLVCFRKGKEFWNSLFCYTSWERHVFLQTFITSFTLFLEKKNKSFSTTLLSTTPFTMYLCVGWHSNMGHQYWNECTGLYFLLSLYQQLGSLWSSFPRLLVGPFDYFLSALLPLDFPFLSHVLRLPPPSFFEREEESSRMGLFRHTGWFMKESMISPMISPMISSTSQNISNISNKMKKIHRIGLNLRVGNRHLMHASIHYILLATALRRVFPSVQFVLYGYFYRMNDKDHQETQENLLPDVWKEEEKKILDAFSELQIPCLSLLSLSSWKEQWAELSTIDHHVIQVGSGSTIPLWVMNQTATVMGKNYFLTPHCLLYEYHDTRYREDCAFHSYIHVDHYISFPYSQGKEDHFTLSPSILFWHVLRDLLWVQSQPQPFTMIQAHQQCHHLLRDWGMDRFHETWNFHHLPSSPWSCPLSGLQTIVEEWTCFFSSLSDTSSNLVTS